MRTLRSLAAVVAVAFVAVLLLVSGGEPPTRSVGHDVRTERDEYQAVAVGETAMAGEFAEAVGWQQLERIALEAAAAARVRVTVSGNSGDGGGCSSLEDVKAGESRGDYRAVNPNGHYGAYQFSQGTWESVGGSGNPADASPEEQDARAQELYNQRGFQPWSVC